MIPLVLREPQSIVCFDGQVGISASAFNTTVAAYSSQLPSHGFAINLCRNRLRFFYALTSVVHAGHCNLLPPNGQRGSIESLVSNYPDCYILHDGYQEQFDGVTLLDIRNLADSPAAAPDVTQIHPADIVIDPAQPAAISFTSGSTGQSRPNLKTWSMLLEGARINAANMLHGASPGLNILATVPAQHMYGLELTITLPLVADVRMHSGQPLYPIDVLDALNQLETPRALVSTPQHLRALVKSLLPFPEVQRIYSATAPMDRALAQQVESCFSGELVEIYGCSEIGSVARRRTAIDSAWTPFSTMTFTTIENATQVTAPHVLEPIELQDHIDLKPDGRFELKGRFGDLINIAGKRGSLAQLNQLLLSVSGVADGVIFDPGKGNTRLAALVVADSTAAKAVRKAILDTLREHVDPVFLPRPVLFVPALPRSETSKLPHQAVLSLYGQIRHRLSEEAKP